jgi:hypothetical protein
MRRHTHARPAVCVCKHQLPATRVWVTPRAGNNKTTKGEQHMRKLVVVLVMVVLSIGVALAAVTWHSGPTFTANGDGTWTATGDGSGFGNKPAVATITISGTVRYTCQNKGGNQSPGQNPVPATTSASADLGNADHNGRGTFNFNAGPLTFAQTISGRIAGCPNGNWQGVDPVVESGPSATLSITQAGKLIFGPTPSCAATPAGACALQ